MLLVAALVTDSSGPDLSDPNVVSPGILGFLAFFLLAVALAFLVWSMNGHLRKVRYRAQDEERAELEKAAKVAAEQPHDADRPS